MSIADDARIAARTVTRISTGDVEPASRARTRAAERRARTTKPQVRTVHPLVLEAALKAAGGDASRLVIESSTSVLVR